MIVKHYYNFGHKINDKIGTALIQESWEWLRIDAQNNDFSFVEENKEAYAQMCIEHSDYRKVAQLILNILSNRCIQLNIVSFGCGKGILEWNLKNLCPQCTIACTDYTAKSLEYIKLLFPECDSVYVADMKEEKTYEELADKNQVALFYRVSTEFDFDTWCDIFSKMYRGGVKYVLFIPTELCTLHIAILEYVKHILNGKNSVFCGYMYSKKTFEKMWEKYFGIKEIIPYKNTAIYLLEKV